MYMCKGLAVVISLACALGAAVAATYQCSGGPAACTPAVTGADPAKITTTGGRLMPSRTAVALG